MAKVVVITGASSGLGACYARSLAGQGPCEFLLIARRRDRLETLARELTGSRCELAIGDLTQEVFLQELERLLRGRRVDLLVNNAGFGSVGRYSLSDLKRQLEMVRLNCLAAMEMVNFVLPQMLAQGSGEIINVCSTASFQAMPYMATYGATKSFLLHWSVALAAELREHGIHVMAQCPGPTATEFHLAAGLTHKLSHLPPMSAELVTDQALRALAQRRDLIIHGRLNTLLAFLNRFFSKKFAAKLVQGVLHSDANDVDRAP